MSLFEGEIAEIINDATADLLPAVVITRNVKAPVDMDSGKRGSPTVITLTGSGVRDEFSVEMKARKLVGEKSVKITIIRLSVKHEDGTQGIVMEEDIVTISGERFRVVKFTNDPASATYVCEGAGYFEAA